MIRGSLFLSETRPPGGTLAPWESLVVEAAGNVIEFWGFKSNHGRVWALLYLRGEPLSAGEIRDTLGLSKGAVSMVTRELEGWGVIHRVRRAGDASWLFDAETNLAQMIHRVITEREAKFVQRIETDLLQAEALARNAKTVSPETLDRVARMRVLAQATRKAMDLFLATARLDVSVVTSILNAPVARGVLRRLGRKR